MKKEYKIILESLLSQKEMENVGELEKECTDDIILARFLCSKDCVFFFDWADGFESFNSFYSFVRTRLKILAGLDFELIDTHFSLLKDRVTRKGDFVPFLIKIFNQQLESYGFACISMPAYDDTYRICIAKHSYSDLLGQIEFMESKIQLCDA